MAAWAVTTAAASLEFDTVNGESNSCYQIDTNHFINFWGGSGTGGASVYDGFVQVFEVNTTTWAVTTAAASLEFDTLQGTYNSCYQIDANHFINFWAGQNADGFVQTFAVNTTTWAVTTAAASLEFDTVNGTYNSCYQVDTNHFINFWAGETTNGYVQIFAVNTTTWAVTTAAARLEFDTVLGIHNSCYEMDENHFINFWQSTVGNDGFVQVFAVNTTTWAVTTAGARLEFDVADNVWNSCYQVDENHFINFWGGVDADNFVQVFTVNTTTWAVTTAAASLEFDTVLGLNNSCYKVDTSHFINFWGGNGADGFAQIFAVELPNDPPTVALNSPADAASTSDTTPTFNFTGTDAQADEVEYELQVDELTFPSPISIEDDFNDNSVDATKWTPWVAGDYVESGAKMNITSTTGASYKGGTCVGTYDLTGKSCWIEVTNVTTGLTDYGNFLQLYLNASNTMTFYVYNDTLIAEKQIATSYTTIASTAYNSSTHRWWRMRESSGTVYFDVSSDGKTWSNFTSASNPFALTALTLSIFMGTDSANGGTETFSFDNLNIYPATIDAYSTTDAGFTAGHPFPSGDATDYTVQSALGTGTYYWRARAIDPLGTNTYGAWATTRSFEITGGSRRRIILTS